MVFTGNHYQPLTPNDYYGWEFQFPRMTKHNTDVLTKFAEWGSNIDAKRRAKAEGITHMYRNMFTKQVPPPLPVDHAFERMSLRLVLADQKG